MMHGSYSPMRPLSKEDKQVFEKAMGDCVGENYEPLLVATQVVAGTNYCFICNVMPEVMGVASYLAKIIIFVPLPGQGEPHIIAKCQIEI